jgi:hypothetical protein
MNSKNMGSIDHVSLNFLGYGRIKQTAQRLFTREQRLWGLDNLVKSIRSEWIKNERKQTYVIIDFYSKEGNIMVGDAISSAMRAKGIGQIIFDIKGFPLKDKTIIRSLKYLFRWLALNGILKDQDKINFQFRSSYTYLSESDEVYLDAQGMPFSLPSIDSIVDTVNVTVEFLNAADLRESYQNFVYRTNFNFSEKVAIITLKFSSQNQK